MKWSALVLVAAALAAPLERTPSDRAPARQQHDHGAPEPTPDAREPVAGQARVALAPERVQLFGIRTVAAEVRPLARSVRTVGIVRTDETRESHVHVKWEGWIEALDVAYVGQQVKKGEPLFSVYSPELVAAQNELLIAKERTALPDLVEAARTRLKRWDVPDAAIAEIERTGKPQRTLPILAPRDGVVIRKEAVLGMFVEPQMQLYTIADLSRVWVVAEVFEYESPLIRAGRAARFTPVGSAGQEFETSVTFVAPTINPETRTLSVRLELANPDPAVRPGAYGTVSIEVPLGTGVVVPADAILDTGVRQVVFVRTAPGVFEPREIHAGPRAGAFALVRHGLEPGEHVVVRGQFMLDSESRLRASSTGGAAHGGH